MNGPRWLWVWAALLPAVALAAPAEHDAQVWVLATGTGALGTPKLRWYGEFQPRLGISRPRFDRMLLRAAVGYRITDQVSLWVGYAWTPVFSPTFTDEQRPFQQLLVDNAFRQWRLVNRTRFEQRVLARVPGVSLRARHLVRGVVPVGTDGFALVASDEVFFNLNAPAGGPLPGFDQNRLFVGTAYKVNANLTLEGGYLMNFVRRDPAIGHRINHSVLLWAATTFD